MICIYFNVKFHYTKYLDKALVLIRDWKTNFKKVCPIFVGERKCEYFLVKEQTSWPLPDESLRTALGFLPNLRIELALRISSSVVLLIGTVPSGHVSPESLHSWKLSLSLSMVWFFPLGLSGGSCKIQCLN